MPGVSVGELMAWAEAGGRWRVCGPGSERVELCACTGETMELRPVLSDEVRAFLTRYPDDLSWLDRA